MYKKRLPKEYLLIYLCARLEINEYIRQEIKEVLNTQIDWNTIIEISNRQQILPFLYYNLSRVSVQSLIPQDIFTIMKNCYYANLKKNLMVEEQISLILKSTNSECLSNILFRGFALMETLYHNPGLRIMVDVDILVKEEELKKISDILIQLGYEEGIEHKEDSRRYNIVFSKYLLPNKSLVIEVHHSLAPARPYKISLPHLWERTQEKIINNQKLLYLSQEDTFLSLALHLRRHTRRLTLKFLLDIAELLNMSGDKLDWTYIKESARNNHIVTTVYLSLYLAKKILMAIVSPKILNEFRPNIIKCFLMRLIINKGNFFIFKKWQGILLRLLLFDNTKDFLFYLWQVSFLERFVAK